MTPLITRSQGQACRRAAEMVADGKWDGYLISTLNAKGSLQEIGWATDPINLFGRTQNGSYDQSQVLLALLWCATIAEEA